MKGALGHCATLDGIVSVIKVHSCTYDKFVMYADPVVCTSSAVLCYRLLEIDVFKQAKHFHFTCVKYLNIDLPPFFHSEWRPRAKRERDSFRKVS